MFESPFELLTVSIPLMDVAVLRSTHSINLDNFPSEYLFQREFYSVCSRLLPHGTFIDPEVKGNQSKKRKAVGDNSPTSSAAPSGSGILDFRIRNGVNWGIEFCVNQGNADLLKYCGAFEARFSGMDVKSRLIVHFCTPVTFPRNPEASQNVNNPSLNDLFLTIKPKQLGEVVSFKVPKSKQNPGWNLVKKCMENQFDTAIQHKTTLLHCVVFDRFESYLFLWKENEIKMMLVEPMQPTWTRHGKQELFPFHQFPSFSPSFNPFG